MTTTTLRETDVLDPFDPLNAVIGASARLKTVPVSELDSATLMKQAIHLQSAISSLEGRRLAVIAELDRRGATEASTGLGAASWLAQQTMVSRRSAARSVRLAIELRDRLPLVGARVALGLIPLESAMVAAATVRDLRAGSRSGPEEIARTDAMVAAADELLARHSAYLSADDFSLIARRMTAQMSAQAAEDSFETKRERRRLSLSQLPGGSWKLDGLLDPESGAIVAAALDPLSRPLGIGDHRTAWHRRADALTELGSQYLNCGLAPTRGTVRPNLNVLLDGTTLAQSTAGDPERPATAEPSETAGPETAPRECREQEVVDAAVNRSSAQRFREALGLLRTRAGLAEIVGAGTVPASVWERIACDAAIRRVVLDPHGLPLDVGYAHRFPTGAQRAALIVRDGGCAHPGCGRAGAWTDAHHIVHWLRGGPTNLANLLLLCRFHHGAIHDGRFRVTLDGVWAVFTDRSGRELGRHRMRAGP